MWEVGHSKQQTHWLGCFFSPVHLAVLLFFFFFFYWNGPNFQMSSKHMRTSGLDLHWCTIVVLWFILGMICHSTRGLHLAPCLMVTLSTAEDCRGCRRLSWCFICNSWPPLVFCVLGYVGTVLFREQADGWFFAAVTAEVVLWLGGSAPNAYSLRLDFKTCGREIGHLETLLWHGNVMVGVI